MRWLIDGYNVIRRDPDLRSAEAKSLETGRKALVRLLAEAAQRTGDSFTVVFDGAPGPGSATPPGRIETVFSRPPDRADDVLIRLAGRWHEAAIVVTSDRAVQDAARRLHAVVIESADFVAAVASGESGIDDTVSDDDDDEDDSDRGASKRGNPRRRSREARVAARALRRLRGF